MKVETMCPMILFNDNGNAACGATSQNKPGKLTHSDISRCLSEAHDSCPLLLATVLKNCYNAA